MTVHRVKFLIIKQTRYTNFSNLFLEWNSTCFGQFLCPSSGVFHCTHNNVICQKGLLTACEQDQDGTSWSYLQTVRWKIPDDGHRNCPKHVEFHSKNKCEKLVYLVGFIIRNINASLGIWLQSTTRGCHSGATEHAGFVGYGAVFLDGQFPMFQRAVVPSSSRIHRKVGNHSSNDNVTSLKTRILI